MPVKYFALHFLLSRFFMPTPTASPTNSSPLFFPAPPNAQCSSLTQENAAFTVSPDDVTLLASSPPTYSQESEALPHIYTPLQSRPLNDRPTSLFLNPANHEISHTLTQPPTNTQHSGTAFRQTTVHQLSQSSALAPTRQTSYLVSVLKCSSKLEWLLISLLFLSTILLIVTYALTSKALINEGKDIDSISEASGTTKATFSLSVASGLTALLSMATLFASCCYRNTSDNTHRISRQAPRESNALLPNFFVNRYTTETSFATHS